MSPSVLLYDVDCGFCKLMVRLALRLDRGRKLKPVAIQSAEGQELLGDVPAVERLDSVHLRAADGRLRSAGSAVTELAGLLPGGALPARLMACFPDATERAYRWVARHRSELGRLGLRTRGEPGGPAEPGSGPRV